MRGIGWLGFDALDQAHERDTSITVEGAQAVAVGQHPCLVGITAVLWGVLPRRYCTGRAKGTSRSGFHHVSCASGKKRSSAACPPYSIELAFC